MNKAMNTTLRKLRRGSYEAGLTENINIRKFKEIYQTLENKQLGYEGRVLEASRLARKMKLEGNLNETESDYISTLMRGTMSYMNEQREKRGKKKIDLLEEIVSSARPAQAGFMTRMKQYASAAAASLMLYVAPPADAAQRTTHFIKPVTIEVHCDGQDFETYKNLKEGDTIDIFEGCDLEVKNPKFAYDKNGKNPIELDHTVTDVKTGEKYVSPVRIPGRTKYAHGHRIETENMGVGKKKLSHLAEVGPNQSDILGSINTYVNIHPNVEAEEAPEQEPAPQMRKQRKKAVPAPAAPVDQKKVISEDAPRTSLLIGGFLGNLKFTPVENPDPEDRSTGVEIGGEYETKDWELFGGGYWESFKKREPYHSDILTSTSSGYNLGAHFKKGILMGGLQVAGGTSGKEREFGHMMGSDGMPQTKVIEYEGRVGVSIGDFNDKTSIQVFGRYGKETREQGIEDIRYGDLVQDSTTSTVKGIGAVVRIEDGVRASVYKTQTSHEALEQDTLQASVEVSKGIGKEKRVRPFAKFTYLDRKEKGPAASVQNLNYNRFVVGVRYEMR